MTSVDAVLPAHEVQSCAIRIGIVGAGFMSQGLTARIVGGTAGMRVVAISDRRPKIAVNTFRCAAMNDVILTDCQQTLDHAIRGSRPAATQDAKLLARSKHIDVLVDVAGSDDFAPQLVVEAFKHGKDVVLMNVEIDTAIHSILQTYAARYGLILMANEGDEPAAQLHLYRWLKGRGCL
jgi:predicted homoserine dehydrogenase-like protein